VNACISHELRNPLNSIIAQNVEKSSLYNNLNEILTKPKPDTQKCIEIIKELQDGIKVQESSANIMSFIVQDMLDYAQIKSDKFRKVNKQFDIRESVEKVMCIQRQKAKDLGIQFTAEFVNINKKAD
jgi:signal transduction histidine kinase